MSPPIPVSPANVRLVVFDWDQTLLNGWALHLKAVAHAARSTKQPVPPKDLIVDRYYSMPFFEHLESLLPIGTIEAVRVYIEFYDRNVATMSKLFDGAASALQALKESGLSLGLLSDKRKEYGAPELNRSEAEGLFDTVLFMEDGRPNKPDPQGLGMVCSGLSILPHQTLYVGDSWVDVRCADSLGAASGAALWGSLAAEKLLAENPDYTFPQITDLVDLLT